MIEGADNAGAAAAELVVVATPWDSVVPTVRALREPLAGKVVISMANALIREGKEMLPLVPPRGSVAAAVQAALPDSLVAAAAPDPSGPGTWVAAADGGVFSFGDAHFHGSTGALQLARPVRSMTAAQDGQGYWMVADDGGIFAFDVPFEGSLPAVRSLLGWNYVASVRMRALASNDGYYILGADGTVWALGNARYFGSAAGSWAVDLMQAP